MNTVSDNLATREQTYNSNRAVLEPFLRGLVAANLMLDRDEAVVTFSAETKRGVREIRNPFWSYDGTDQAVDPVAYYGKAFVQSEFLDLALTYLAKHPVDVGGHVASEKAPSPYGAPTTRIDIYANGAAVVR